MRQTEIWGIQLELLEGWWIYTASSRFLLISKSLLQLITQHEFARPVQSSGDHSWGLGLISITNKLHELVTHHSNLQHVLYMDGKDKMLKYISVKYILVYL